MVAIQTEPDPKILWGCLFHEPGEDLRPSNMQKLAHWRREPPETGI